MGPRPRQSSASPCSSPDYHIGVHEFFYSVPHALIHAQVEVRTTVVVFHRGQRVAAHARRWGRKHATTPDHMPNSHRHYAEWSPERFLRWAAKIGPITEGGLI